MPPQSASSRQPSIPPRLDIWRTPTPFVGRDQETAALRECLNAAARGEGALVLLAGEAGIGKTRLCAEATALARQRGFFAIAGHCYDMQGTPPYVPFVEAIEYVARVVPREDSAKPWVMRPPRSRAWFRTSAASSRISLPRPNCRRNRASTTSSTACTTSSSAPRGSGPFSLSWRTCSGRMTPHCYCCSASRSGSRRCRPWFSAHTGM